MLLEGEELEEHRSRVPKNGMTIEERYGKDWGAEVTPALVGYFESVGFPSLAGLLAV